MIEPVPAPGEHGGTNLQQSGMERTTQARDAMKRGRTQSTVSDPRARLSCSLAAHERLVRKELVDAERRAADGEVKPPHGARPTQNGGRQLEMSLSDTAAKRGGLEPRSPQDRQQAPRHALGRVPEGRSA